MFSSGRHRPDVVLLAESWGDDRHQIVCPGCGEAYVYPLLSKVRSENTDDYTSPAGERGSWIEIPMACEVCDHDGANPAEGFSIVLAAHKGETYLTVLGRSPDWDNPELAAQ